MISHRFLASAGLAALLAMALGCGPPSKPAAGGGGATTKSTDPDLNRPMTIEEIAALKPPAVDPNKVKAVAEEVSFFVNMLSEDPRIADQAKGQMAGQRILFTGTVVAKSPEDAEAPFLVLDGGEHRGKKYTVKCVFAATEGESLKKINPQDNIRVEGATDANVKDLLLEFKECVLKPAETPADGGTDAEKTSDEKSPSTKP